jgi:uncharacterized membrane protein
MVALVTWSAAIAPARASAARSDVHIPEVSVPDVMELNPQEAIQDAAKLPPDAYMLGKVEQLEGEQGSDGGLRGTLRILDGAERGSVVSTSINDSALANKGRAVHVGDTVVVVKSALFGGRSAYYIADNYRLHPLLYITLLFVFVAVLFGRMRGLMSMVGLATTVGVMVYGIVPQIVAGADPLRVILVGGVCITVLSLYLGHGFNRRTSIALCAMLLTFGISAWMATQFVSWSNLFGMGSEDAFYLQSGGFANINLRGLLLGGIMLGVLGILDDITTAQAAVVDELKRANPALQFSELYRRGLSVGREHIASLINTLFLAYAGVSLPLFLLFSTNQGQPLWFIINSEQIAEEIVRTLVGSLCLILAVPITTVLAAAYFGRYGAGTPSSHDHGHTPAHG